LEGKLSSFLESSCRIKGGANIMSDTTMVLRTQLGLLQNGQSIYKKGLDLNEDNQIMGDEVLDLDDNGEVTDSEAWYFLDRNYGNISLEIVNPILQSIITNLTHIGDLNSEEESFLSNNLWRMPQQIKESIVHVIINDLRCSDFDIKISALSFLYIYLGSDIRNKDVAEVLLPEILSLLEDSNAQIRRKALSVLSEDAFKRPEHLEIYKRMIQDAEAIVREQAINSFLRFNNYFIEFSVSEKNEYFTIMVNLLNDASPDVRAAAVGSFEWNWIIYDQKVLEVIPKLKEMANMDPSLEVRTRALGVLGRVANIHFDMREQILPILLTALRDENEMIREKAAFSLTDVYEYDRPLDNATAEELISIIQSGRRGRREALHALFWMTSQNYENLSNEIAEKLFKALKKIVKNYPASRVDVAWVLINLWRSRPELQEQIINFLGHYKNNNLFREIFCNCPDVRGELEISDETCIDLVGF
jgi:HEAT repeat protein